MNHYTLRILNEYCRPRAAAEARRVYKTTLDILGGSDGGIGFLTLKSKLELLYIEYQRNPTHEMTLCLTKIEDAFQIIERLATSHLVAAHFLYKKHP